MRHAFCRDYKPLKDKDLKSFDVIFEFRILKRLEWQPLSACLQNINFVLQTNLYKNLQELILKRDFMKEIYSKVIFFYNFLTS